ncbi:cysteine-rich motor neuron 1 protein-like [Trichomycterus rosablanca]|uniref:cysteine-rich motor neuron 1 protein-like n=1 Tax=Trichomycterus rosablanca TaxID=2290929 RepID=UPI002F35572E
MRNSGVWVVLSLCLLVVRVPAAQECAPCTERACPSVPWSGCEEWRVLARDPCGCCDQCARLELELCGGENWELGYCAQGLTCTSLNHTGTLNIPDTGVCKGLSNSADSGVEDKRCPLVSGCNRVNSECICELKHSCLVSFSYPDKDTCISAMKTDAQKHEKEVMEKSEEPSYQACAFSGCNLTAIGCECVSQSCNPHFTYSNRSQCQQAAVELRCAGITCPTIPVPDCPPDSVLTRSYTPPSGCCPTIPPVCTCAQCPLEPKCPSGHKAVVISEAAGAPGNCCDSYSCQRVSPKCVHNGKEFAEGKVYRTDPCWLCQCRGGISFCSKIECAESECDNIYIPEGECCPVCTDVELVSAESTKASCWVNHKLRQHEEQWKEDDCTFCQCKDGEHHCTAMACKQSCHNPVKIPGECCPFCEEPSYETVSPLLCPPLENCTLSGNDCPFGFLQDQNGCLLCQCLANDSCPKLSRYCTKQCPMGYEKDDYGCEVCECAECRPLTCRKTCPYGYVRNKHGCEMCRCIKCPPFTCEKQCSHGYKQNRKGCNVCLCKESGSGISTTTSSPVSSSCLTVNGQQFEEGESWHDGCRDCYCHAGREMCVLISCPVPSCTNPVLRPHQCCPSCEEDLGSGRPEGMDMVVCRAPGDNLYVEGDTWDLDECTRCTCRQGRVLCDSEVCPPVLCQTPTRTKGSCCHICQEDTLSGLLPVNNSQREYCISEDGNILLTGDSWKPNACTSCICSNGTIQCFTQRCPNIKCRVPVLRKGQCCPQCLEATTTSVPLMSTSTGKSKANEISTTTDSSVVWVTMHTVAAITDGSGLTEDFRNEAELSLIYQVAAWILAGLLLCIIFFVVVGLLINKKKKWVQMSCYNAPKKTVILKKHVNKSSVEYTEPSKENKHQNTKNDCGKTFTPSLGPPYGERISIPRAKLSNGQARVQR